MNAALTLQQRIDRYTNNFGPGLQIINNRIEGVFWLGNNYQNKSNYYGAYPGNLLSRIDCLFSDVLDVDTLHLFSGKIPAGLYTRFDRRGDLFTNYEEEKGLVRGEAENLSSYFPERKFKAIKADPPYSEEDAKKYGTILVNREKVFEECHQILEPGGYMTWLDQVIPMFSGEKWKMIGSIGIFISTNHRTRGLFFYERI